MRERRAEDPITGRMLHLRASVKVDGTTPGITFREIRTAGGEERLVDATEAYASLAESQERLILLETGHAEDVWLMLGGVLGRVPAAGGADPTLTEKAAQVAARWRRANLARWRRLELPTSLIGYAQALVAADTPEGVSNALSEAAVRIFGGHRAVVLRRDEDLKSLQVLSSSGSEPLVDAPAVPDHPIFAEPGILLRGDPRLSGEGSLAGLAPLFEALAPETLYHIPSGDRYVLMVSERRADRRVAVEEWQILRLLTAQAEGALRRISLYEAVHNLSLTDELTGLANRRHMKLVLSHAIAAAKRGVPLTLIIVDVDDFKQINDQHGHLAGDRVLRRLAQCLQTQGRGSDLVVRFGGDEFIVILPGGDRQGAESFVRRVRARLDPGVSVTFGIAEYDAASTATMEELLEAADRQLYGAKRNRSRTAEPRQR